MYTIHFQGDDYTSDDPRDVLRTVVAAWRQDIWGFAVYDGNHRVLTVWPGGGVSFPLVSDHSVWAPAPSAINPGSFYQAFLAPSLD